MESTLISTAPVCRLEAAIQGLRRFRSMPPIQIAAWWSVVASRARRQQESFACDQRSRHSHAEALKRKLSEMPSATTSALWKQCTSRSGHLGKKLEVERFQPTANARKQTLSAPASMLFEMRKSSVGRSP